MSVPDAFDRGAGSYDRLVGLNPGYHEHLRRAAAEVPAGARHVLDAGCGTGASTAALLRRVPEAEILGIDASGGMLGEAKKKQWPDNVGFVRTSIEEATDAGVEGPFDAVFAAYVIRNTDDPDSALKALHQKLLPGGVLVVHDYSVADSGYARFVWNAVCWSAIIPLGRIVAHDASLYRYLWRSVLRFDGVQEFTERLARAGFANVRHSTATGWQRGITHTFVADKA